MMPVIKPPSANPVHARCLCSRLELGSPKRALSRVYGGFHHKMWRLDTHRDSYAVKQLSPYVDLDDPGTVNHYNSTEDVAESFAALGIPALFALRYDGCHLQVIDGTGYLVYPWTNATAMGKHQITEEHVRRTARIMARMHSADIDAPRLIDSRFDYHPEEKITALVQRARQCNARHADILMELLPSFLHMADSHRQAIQVLEQQLVISHGDIDHKNVLWNGATDPIIIDWESARRLNPTYEIVLEALEWSGITATFQHSLFEKMISAYRQSGGVIETDYLHASFDSIFGDWLNWLMFNVGRSVDMEDHEQRLIGSEQVELALSAILRLERLLPQLVSAVQS